MKVEACLSSQGRGWGRGWGGEGRVCKEGEVGVHRRLHLRDALRKVERHVVHLRGHRFQVQVTVAEGVAAQVREATHSVGLAAQVSVGAAARR